VTVATARGAPVVVEVTRGGLAVGTYGLVHYAPPPRAEAAVVENVVEIAAEGAAAEVAAAVAAAAAAAAAVGARLEQAAQDATITGRGQNPIALVVHIEKP
jgi:hypothetical protein